MASISSSSSSSQSFNAGSSSSLQDSEEDQQALDLAKSAIRTGIEKIDSLDLEKLCEAGIQALGDKVVESLSNCTSLEDVIRLNRITTNASKKVARSTSQILKQGFLNAIQEKESLAQRNQILASALSVKDRQLTAQIQRNQILASALSIKNQQLTAQIQQNQTLLQASQTSSSSSSSSSQSPVNTALLRVKVASPAGLRSLQNINLGSMSVAMAEKLLMGNKVGDGARGGPAYTVMRTQADEDGSINVTLDNGKTKNISDLRPIRFGVQSGLKSQDPKYEYALINLGLNEYALISDIQPKVHGNRSEATIFCFKDGNWEQSLIPGQVQSNVSQQSLVPERILFEVHKHGVLGLIHIPILNPYAVNCFLTEITSSQNGAEPLAQIKQLPNNGGTRLLL